MPTGSQDAQPPTAQRNAVRGAAAGLVQALHTHLAAVEASTGEGDQDVVAAYLSLLDATEAYEDLLYDVYEEVVPFSTEDEDDLDDEDDDLDEDDDDLEEDLDDQDIDHQDGDGDDDAPAEHAPHDPTGM